MFTIFIIHGYAGHSKENWFPWLEKELTKFGHQVIVPNFPDSSYPRLSSWLEYFATFKQNPDQDAMIIGHSLGGAFLLRALEQYRFKAAFLVASVSGPIGHPVDALIANFTHQPFSWARITNNCQNFQVFHSDNDPYIPLGQAELLARKLNTTMTLIKNGGHLNSLAGYKEFPLLLERIRSIC
ncbi:MAG TPA: alpha/beta fold hydrolase [Candidatus Nanoarchaeia archaeon]|nr:alpha/beta fold hydrolase [Candidatus Nanoarchaeia archaeon]